MLTCSTQVIPVWTAHAQVKYTLLRLYSTCSRAVEKSFRFGLGMPWCSTQVIPVWTGHAMVQYTGRLCVLSMLTCSTLVALCIKRMLRCSTQVIPDWE
jgi:hypothetical protein